MKNYLSSLKATNPIVHNITNYVTVNDCANVILAIGGSPIMADDICEVEQIVSISKCLNVNIGTLNVRIIDSMIKVAKCANSLNVPVIFDPVGVGASALRSITTKRFLDEIKISVIRGNVSEIKTILGMSGSGRGVDANDMDKITGENIDEILDRLKTFSKEHNCVIAISGETDIVTDKDKSYVIKNGVSMMSRITGTGCMSSALIGTFVGGNAKEILDATAFSVITMGICGELSYKKMLDNDFFSGMYRSLLIDEIGKFTYGKFTEYSKYEVR